MFLGYVSPYDTRVQNFLSIFNETIILLASYELFLFTEFVLDDERRYEQGWVFLSLIMFSVAINFSVMIFRGIKMAKLKYKRWIERRKWQKLANEEMKRREKYWAENNFIQNDLKAHNKMI